VAITEALKLLTEEVNVLIIEPVAITEALKLLTEDVNVFIKLPVAITDALKVLTEAVNVFIKLPVAITDALKVLTEAVNVLIKLPVAITEALNEFKLLVAVFTEDVNVLIIDSVAITDALNEFNAFTEEVFEFKDVAVIVLTNAPAPSNILIEPEEIYKSLQIFDSLPKSKALLIDGIKDELILAAKVTVSEVESPIVVLPFKVRFPLIKAFDVICKFDAETNDDADTDNELNSEVLPTVANVISPLFPPTCNVVNDVFTNGSPNASEPDLSAVEPLLNLSAIYFIFFLLYYINIFFITIP